MSKIKYKQSQIDKGLVKVENASRNYVETLNKAKAARVAVLTNKETKQELVEYIFGYSDTNPLQGITDEQNNAYDALVYHTDEIVEGIFKS